MATKVTIQDIANELQLSRNTVSKAINNTGVLAAVSYTHLPSSRSILMPASWLVPLRAEDIPDFYEPVRSSVTDVYKRQVP